MAVKRSPTPKRWPLPLLLVVAAAIPRFFRLGDDVPTLDEVRTWELADAIRTAGSLQPLAYDTEAPLFPLLNVLLLALGADGAESLRWLSATIGTLTIPVVYAALRQLSATPRTAGTIGLLLAWAPFLTLYSRLARPYALVGFFSAIFLWSYLRLRNASDSNSGTSRWSLRTMAAGGLFLAAACHYYALLFPALLLFTDALRDWRQKHSAGLRETAVVTVLGAALLAPLLPGALSLYTFGKATRYWEAAGIHPGGVFTEQFLGIWPNALVLPETIYVLGAILILLTVATGWRRLNVGFQRLFVVAAAPALIMYAAGLVFPMSPLYFPRVFIGSTPLLIAGWWLAGQTRLHRVLQTVILLPALLSTLSIMFAGRAHPETVSRLPAPDFWSTVGGNLDPQLVLVHHWGFAPALRYHAPPDTPVVGLGRTPFRHYSPTQARAEPLREAARLARETTQPIALVFNMAGTYTVAPDEIMQAVERSGRHKLGEVDCLAQMRIPDPTICTRVVLYAPLEETRTSEPSAPER